MNVFQSLQSINNYPIPTPTIYTIAMECGFDVEAEITSTMLQSASWKMAKSRIYDFLSEAPNVSQGGITFSFTTEEKKSFKSKAISLRNAIGKADEGNNGTAFGYKGESL